MRTYGLPCVGLWRRGFVGLRRGVGAALLAAGLLVVSGCGLLGGGDSARMPDDFTRATTKLISFGYPGSWQKLPDNAYPEGYSAAFGQASGARAAEVAVYTKLPESDGARAVVEGFNAKLQFTRGFERVEQRSVEVPDAGDAWRLDYTYRAEGGADGATEGQRLEGTDVAVVGEGGAAVLVRITRDPNALSDELVDEIVGSIAVRT